MAAPKTPATTATPTVTPHVEADVDTAGRTVTGRFAIENLPTFGVAEAAKPLYAYVGAADLVVEQIRTIPTQVRTLPTQVKALRDDVETRVEKATERAGDLYAQLTVRGERLVTQIRRQPATEVAVAEGKEAVAKAGASATAARKAAKAGEQAVEDASGKLG